jgi:sugar phosphate isomerase/epimerase
MIKLATMSSVCPDWNLKETIAGMKRHGYQGLEPRVEWNHASGIEAGLSAAGRAEVRKQMEDEGLEICCVATSVRMAAPEPDAQAKHVEDLKKYIELAADLGCPLIRTFGGQRARDRELAAIVDYVVEGYMKALPMAADAGVTVLMETHDDWSCSAPVRAVVEKAGHPNLKILWDIMHPQRMLEKPEETFQVVGEYTHHLHAHDGSYVDGKMQVGPLGKGAIDHAVPLQLLNEAGFSGYFSVEVIHAPGSDHDAEGVLKQYGEQFREIMENM